MLWTGPELGPDTGESRALVHGRNRGGLGYAIKDVESELY